MKDFKRVFAAEVLKLKRAKIVLISFLAFAIAPVMGGLFMLIIDDPQAAEQADLLVAKAEMMGFSGSWASYLRLLNQAMGVGGILIFGFVASWLFGREYSDGTVKDLLALPVSKSGILRAKFVIYLLWGMMLALSNLCIGLIIGLLTNLEASAMPELAAILADYSLTTILTLILGTPVAFLAFYGEGVLAPLGFVVLMLVLSQIIGAIGYGSYFPWSVPALHSGLGGELKGIGYFILLFTGALGYLVSLFYFKYSDQ